MAKLKNAGAQRDKKTFVRASTMPQPGVMLVSIHAVLPTAAALEVLAICDRCLDKKTGC